MTTTYSKGYLAHTTKGGKVTLPDEVFQDQRAYDGQVIECVDHQTGEFCYAVLRGDLYGLGTPGTGDPIVELCDNL